MKTQNIVALIGLLIVITFGVDRIVEVRGSLSQLTHLGPDLLQFSVFILLNVAILLAIIGFGYLLWRAFRGDPVRKGGAEPSHLSASHWRHVIEVAVLSVVIAMAAAGLSRMRTPGWQLAIGLGLWSGEHGFSPYLALTILLGVGLDAAICFAIFWGGRLLWMRYRYTRRVHGSNPEKQ